MILLRVLRERSHTYNFNLRFRIAPYIYNMVRIGLHAV